MVKRDTQSCTIYFVDDDRGIIHSTVQWLTLSGLNVKAFADPKILLRTLKAGEPCVVVSDIRMPDIDGISLMKTVHQKDQDIPFVLITGHGDISLAVEAMKSGAHEFLTKPFSPERLLEILKIAQRKRLDLIEKRLNAKKQPAVKAVKLKPHHKHENSERKISDKSVYQDDGTLNQRIDKHEKKIIQSVLKKHNGAINPALKELELPRRTLNAKMKKHGITRRDFM